MMFQSDRFSCDHVFERGYLDEGPGQQMPAIYNVRIMSTFEQFAGQPGEAKNFTIGAAVRMHISR